MGSNGITGTLKFIADYSSAGYTGEEQSGNFLVLHAEVPDEDDVTITCELVGGVHGEKTLDPDGLAIFRITNKDTQKVKFTAKKTGYDDVVKTYNLSGLTLLDS